MKKLFLLITAFILIASFQVKAQIPETMPCYIDSAGTNSDTLDLGYKQLVSVTFPAIFTGASLTVYHSNYEDSAFVQVNDLDGNNLTITKVASRTVPVDPRKTFYLRRYIYFKSSSTETGRRSIPTDKGVL